MTTPHDSKQAPLITPSDLDAATRALLGAALHQLTADVVALYFKTKAYHWHVYGAHFKEYHELFDEQGVQIFAMIDVLAERARKLGQTTLRGLGDAARTTRIDDDDQETTMLDTMLRALIDANRALVVHMREIHSLADDASDFATASVIESFIDEGERRIWFLFETISNT